MAAAPITTAGIDHDDGDFATGATLLSGSTGIFAPAAAAEPDAGTDAPVSGPAALVAPTGLSLDRHLTLARGHRFDRRAVRLRGRPLRRGRRPPADEGPSSFPGGPVTNPDVPNGILPRDFADVGALSTAGTASAPRQGTFVVPTLDPAGRRAPDADGPPVDLRIQNSFSCAVVAVAAPNGSRPMTAAAMAAMAAARRRRSRRPRAGSCCSARRAAWRSGAGATGATRGSAGGTGSRRIRRPAAPRAARTPRRRSPRPPR